MANPQVDNGKFVRIANTVTEALCRAHLTGHEYAVMLAVIRKTWGWQKKKAKIPVADLCELTGISDHGLMSRITTALERKCLITKNQCSGKVTEYVVNKDYETWDTCPTHDPGVNTRECKSKPTHDSGVNPQPVSTHDAGVMTPMTLGSTPHDLSVMGHERKSRGAKDTYRKTVPISQKKLVQKTVPISQKKLGTQHLVALFIDGQTAQIGEKPVTRGGTIAGILIPLVKDYGQQEVERRINDYFASTVGWIVERKYSIETFRTKFNELHDGPLKDRIEAAKKQKPVSGWPAPKGALQRKYEEEKRLKEAGDATGDG
jgi:phage replication O-like protein O